MINLAKKVWDAFISVITIKNNGIMLVHYDVDTKEIELIDWIGQRIVKKTLWPGLWDSLKPNFRLSENTDGLMPTRIYIWSKKECLAYCEPIDNYVDNYALLSTGHGFTVSSGVRYGESMALKCKCCGRKWPEIY